MKYYPATAETADHAVLKEEYQAARQIGAVRLGETVLFFRTGLRTYFIPYTEVKRCFRRVYQVPVKMCCGRGEIDYEHLILGVAAPAEGGETENDGAEELSEIREIADIPLPGTKAAQELIRALKEKVPEADFRSPRECGEQSAASKSQGERMLNESAPAENAAG